LFNRHEAFVAGLEVGVVGSGSAALGTIVKNGVVGQLPCQVQHIPEAGSYALGDMCGFRYRQVTGEYGKRIDQYVVVSFERDAFLHCRQVGGAEKAFTFLNGLCIYFGSGRYDTCRIELYFIKGAVYIQFFHLHFGKDGVVITRRFPGSKLLG